MDVIELIVFGGIAIFVGIMAFLHLVESINVKWFEKRIPQFTLIMLSLVIGALLLESQHIRNQGIEKQQALCDSMENLFWKYEKKYQSHELGGQYLLGVEDVHQSALELIRRANERIRVFWVVGGPRPPASYFESSAEVIAETMRKGISVGIDVVYALDVENPPDDFLSAISKDRDIYVKHGVDHLVRPYVANMKKPYGFSVLTIDRKHAQISFPPLVEIKSLERAMEFVDQNRLVADLVGWFDSQVIPSATPFHEWQKAKQSSAEDRPSN
jgi:hypothetical protein